MLFDNLPLQEKKYVMQYGGPEQPFYYRFDYDERSYSINMQFQHFHPFFEMFVLLDDNAAHLIEGQPYDLNLYDIVCLRPGLLHKTQYPQGNPKRRFVIHFSRFADVPALEDEYAELLTMFDVQSPVYRFSAGVQHQLMEILTDILLQHMRCGPLNKLYTHRRFLEFLGLMHANRVNNQFRARLSGNSMADKVYAICAHIHAHYAEPLSLEALADQFYVSSCHLSRQFPKITGFSVTEYVQRTRVRNAQQSLSFTNRKITDVAAECGFSSFSQFNRVFRKCCGASPSEYRKGSNRNFSL